MSELPKPGEVWGVPDKPETWNFIVNVEGDTLKRCLFGISGGLTTLITNLPSYYVRIFPRDTP